MDFRIQGLPAEHFTHLFSMSDEELARHLAVRRVADDRPFFPCRVSLTNAQEGQEIVLVNYEYHQVDSPYRASYAIYVRAGEHRFDEQNQVPDQLRKATLSLRAFDKRGMLVDCALTDGAELEPLIERLLAKQRTAYIHAHFAQAGCYAAHIERA